MTKEEAIKATRGFLDSCYEFWFEAQHCISEYECDAIEFLIKEAEDKNGK